MSHAALPELPDWPRRQSTWKHVRSKQHYNVACIARVEADLSPVVVYSMAGSTDVWTRPLDEFLDGRFEHLHD